ncbi:hypothetical protein Tco_1312721 [Tanacetum coccineum]
MRMEPVSYYQVYYSLWQVILNGDGPIQVTTDEKGVETEVPPKTAQAILQRQRERKAKSILLLDIPDEYQLRFHGIKEAKFVCWPDIRVDVGGNSLPSSWNNVALIMRNKDGIDDLDIDDLYNNLKVFEADIKDGLEMTGVYVAQDEPTEFALMAYTSNSSGSDTEALDQILNDSVYRPTVNKTSVSVSQVKTSTSQTSNTSVKMPRVESVRPSGLIIEDWVSDDEDIFQSNDLQATDKPSFKRIKFTNARNESVKPKQAEKPRIITQNPKGNPQQALKNKGIFDSGCSRHMTGNKDFLTDYQDIDGGFVAFGGSARGASENEQVLKNVLDNMMDQEKEASEQSDAVRKEFEAQCNRELLQGKATFNTSSASRTLSPPHDPLMPELEDTTKVQPTSIFGNAYDDDLEHYNTSYADESVGAEADLNNMEPSTVVSPIPTTRIHFIHPKAQIIGDPMSPVQTRSKIKKNSREHAMIRYIQKKRRTNHKDFQNCLFACFLSQHEPTKISQALNDESWVEAMQEELL